MATTKMKQVRIAKDDLNKCEQPVDDWNSSCNPSYTGFEMPYNSVCRQRYKRAKRKYERQFLYELEMQEAMQSSAYDAMRFHRHFAITTLWPPLHTRKEIEYVLNNMYKLTRKQEKRLNELLLNDVI